MEQDVEIHKRHYIPSDKELLKKRAGFLDMESTLIKWIQEERKIDGAVRSFPIKS